MCAQPLRSFQRPAPVQRCKRGSSGSAFARRSRESQQCRPPSCPWPRVRALPCGAGFGQKQRLDLVHALIVQRLPLAQRNAERACREHHRRPRVLTTAARQERAMRSAGPRAAAAESPLSRARGGALRRCSRPHQARLHCPAPQAGAPHHELMTPRGLLAAGNAGTACRRSPWRNKGLLPLRRPSAGGSDQKCVSAGRRQTPPARPTAAALGAAGAIARCAWRRQPPEAIRGCAARAPGAAW
ncbi:hypothetical protein FA09DRAFT_56787 [Tilletiopsis washingtonensis]|uniref:Uncharacterized protein n=1 Tax=Tilletiopsis washingtonensis TaxID=58919 RepID=A0A316Z8B3_9BASI|nr:hypothetical protein FA09DRAFT_56787 [Tilletiopsis washingtonensis]PWN97496.1 hypothetical protein FA09DRAFT_56787 [Tilletiopsis washingtonensis]